MLCFPPRENFRPQIPQPVRVLNCRRATGQVFRSSALAPHPVRASQKQSEFSRAREIIVLRHLRASEFCQSIRLKSFLRRFSPKTTETIDKIIAVALHLMNPQHLKIGLLIAATVPRNSGSRCIRALALVSEMRLPSRS